MPVFDLGSPVQHATPEGEPDGQSGRPTSTIVALVLGILALLIGLSVLSGGGDDPPADESAATSTTSTTSTTRPPSTTRPRPNEAENRPIVTEPWGEAAGGLALVVIGHDGTVAAVDLATGRQHISTHDAIAPVGTAIWLGDSLAVVGARGNVINRLANDGSDEWRSIEMSSHHVEPSWGADGILWAWSTTGQPAEVLLPVSGGGFEHVVLPAGVTDMQPIGAIDGWALFSGSEGIFALNSAGEIRRLGYGRVLGIDGSYMVRTDCDDQLRCRLIRDRVVDGRLDMEARADLGQNNAHWAKPAPDGRTVALLDYGGTRSALRLVSLDGSADIESDGNSVFFMGGAHWVAGGDALAWVSQERTVNFLWVRGDHPIGEIQSHTIDLRDFNRFGHSGILLLPLADVPTALLPRPE